MDHQIITILINWGGIPLITLTAWCVDRILPR